jgi:glyoxylase-like metal-dependent hydrolase (beta-lactamase superfamily II)
MPAWSRREFLATLALAPLPAGLRILPEVINVGLLERNGKRLLIDCGEAPGPADWVLVTHHHRDQWSGAPRLGAKVAAPEAERRFFERAEEFWDQADAILDHRYDFRPHLFTGRESVPVARGLRDGEVFEWEGLRIEALTTPGHTDGSLTYLVDVGNRRVAFTGDLIHSPGKLWEFYSLQKRYPGMRGDYWGFGGAVEELIGSLDRVLAKKPDVMVPSHGSVIENPAQAISELKSNLRAAMDNYLTTAAWRIYFKGIFPEDRAPMLKPLLAVRPPKWLRHFASTTRAIVADDGSAFLSDCGFQTAINAIDQAIASGEIRSVDGIWITHYHDDHTQMVNAAKRKYGAKVYVERHMVDIIENPLAYQMPCLFPESIRVDRPMEHGETIEWKGFRLTAYHFPGQTLYHDGLLAERDGVKAFFTGDSFANFGIDDYCSQNRCFLGRDVGYEKCFRLLLDVKPDLLVAAHWGPLPISAEYLRRAQELFAEREKLFGRLFPWENPNFGLDPGWIRCYPYRQKSLPGGTVAIEARVYNHAPKPKQVRLEWRAPAGWTVPAPATATIGARAEGSVRFTLRAPERPARRRQVLGLAVTVEGMRLGEFAEAIVDFLAG